MEITIEQIKKAKRILPFEEKIVLIKTNAIDCIEKYNSEKDYYIEDIFSKELILAKILLTNYLGISQEEEELTLELYDSYFENNPINQLERLKNKCKADKQFDIVEKIFDLLTDYNKFCKMFNIEVYSLLQAQNDIVDRLLNNNKFIDAIAEKIANTSIEKLTDKIAEQVTPETLKDAINDFGETIKQANNVVEKFDKKIEG